MKKSILDLTKERVVILDGAMGSLLISAGLPAGLPPEKWNVDKPEKISEIHKSYFEAGSDAVLTNTFGGSRLKLAAHGYQTNIENFNMKAVENAKKVCPEDKYVIGDIGPSGQFIPPVGKASVADFESNFLEQAKILANSDIDLFLVETMVDLVEAEAAVKAIRKVSKLPILVSITYQKTKRGYFTIMGNTVPQCVETLTKAGANVLGANCTIGSDEMIDLVSLLREQTDLPILVKPNAGKPQLVGGETIYPTTPKDFAHDIKQMVKAGANIVGGCCGSSPEFIKEIVQVVQE